MARVTPLLALALAATLALAGCGGSDDEPEASSSAAAPASAPASTEAAAAGSLVGMKVADLPEPGGDLDWRIVEEDGQPKPVTMDLRCGRHNLTVENGVVVTDAAECAEEEQAPDVRLVGQNLADLPQPEGEFDWRVVELDGQPQAVTMDIRCGRHNLSVVDGKIVDDIIECAEEAAAATGSPTASDLVGQKVADLPPSTDALTWRVVVEDGQPQPATMDLRCGRHNLTVEGGVVTADSVECAEEAPAGSGAATTS